MMVQQMPRSFSTQSGVALAIVVWFIAGMALLVSGIVAQARVDTQLTQLHVARAKAVAAGDGAIRLAMLDLLAARDRGNGDDLNPITEHRVGDIEVEVRLQDTAGLLDLNVATPQQLTALLGVADSDIAPRRLANSVVEWRQGQRRERTRRKSLSQFQSPEDLLQVPGFNRTTLDGIRDYVVAGKPARGALRLAVAPRELQSLLGRATADQPVDAAQAAGGVSPMYRADALVSYGDQQWLRRRWIAVEPSQHTRLPWRPVRTEPPRIYEG